MCANESRRPEIGYWPVAKLFGTLFGKDAGKIAGVFSVFALSGWLHHQGTSLFPFSRLVTHFIPFRRIAIISATHSLPTPTPPLPFFTAYGAPLFFLAQAFAVLLESYYMRWTGRKLHGAGAVLWTYAVVVGFGCWAARSWVRLLSPLSLLFFLRPFFLFPLFFASPLLPSIRSGTNVPPP